MGNRTGRGYGTGGRHRDVKGIGCVSDNGKIIYQKEEAAQEEVAASGQEVLRLLRGQVDY